MKAGEEREDGVAVDLWDCGSPLYDSFEVVSVSHLLDRKLMAFAGESQRLTGWFSDGSDRISSRGEVGPTKVVLLSGLMGMSSRKRKVDWEMKKERLKKMKASFHGICSSFAFWKK